VIRRFLLDTPGKRQGAARWLMNVKLSSVPQAARAVNGYTFCLTWGTAMKPLMHLKTAVLLAYVALCTHLVLDLMQADPALHTAAAHVFSE
jgi:hypothetical protein